MTHLILYMQFLKSWYAILNKLLWIILQHFQQHQTVNQSIGDKGTRPKENEQETFPTLGKGRHAHSPKLGAHKFAVKYGCLYSQGMVLHRGPRLSRHLSQYCYLPLSIDTSIKLVQSCSARCSLSLSINTSVSGGITPIVLSCKTTQTGCQWHFECFPIVYSLLLCVGLHTRVDSWLSVAWAIHENTGQGHTIVYSFTRNGHAWRAPILCTRIHNCVQ